MNQSRQLTSGNAEEKRKRLTVSLRLASSSRESSSSDEQVTLVGDWVDSVSGDVLQYGNVRSDPGNNEGRRVEERV
jgi:hypothetical protein